MAQVERTMRAAAVFMAALCLMVETTEATMGRPISILPGNLTGQSRRARDQWVLFKHEHTRTYANTVEETLRFGVFSRNLAQIDAANSEMPRRSYTLGVNQFSDLTPREFQSTYLMTPVQSVEVLSGSPVFEAPDSVVLPKAVDWRSKNAVTAVKDQGQCGSCWIFSATGALEGAQAIATGKPAVSLSEEQFMACYGGKKADPCGEGLPSQAIKYAQNTSVCSEAAWPYKPPSGKPYPPPKPLICHSADCSKPAEEGLPMGTIASVTYVTPKSEAALMAAVAQQPISIMIVADALSSYQSGVFSGHCMQYTTNHAVLLVGYGTDPKQGDYWIIKNSWTSKFGEQGYLRLLRNDPACKNYGTGGLGILFRPIFPVMSNGTSVLV